MTGQISQKNNRELFPLKFHDLKSQQNPPPPPQPELSNNFINPKQWRKHILQWSTHTALLYKDYAPSFIANKNVPLVCKNHSHYKHVLNAGEEGKKQHTFNRTNRDLLGLSPKHVVFTNRTTRSPESKRWHRKCQSRKPKSPRTNMCKYLWASFFQHGCRSTWFSTGMDLAGHTALLQ